MTENEEMLYEALKRLEEAYCDIVEHGTWGLRTKTPSEHHVVKSARIALSKIDGQIRYLGLA